MDYLSASSYTGVTSSQIWSGFYALDWYFSVYSHFSEFTQRIFKYGDIQNTGVTPDKEPNIFTY